MSIFFKQPENQRLLQKVTLKNDSGIDIRKDTLNMISSAFESLTDEDWLEFEQQHEQSQQLFITYYPTLSPIPAAALRQLVEKLPTIIEDIRMQRINSAENACSYELTLTTAVAEISKRNDIVHQYTDDMDEQAEIDKLALAEPESFLEWQHNMNQFCQNYLNAESDELGFWLLAIFLHSALIPAQ